MEGSFPRAAQTIPTARRNRTASGYRHAIATRVHIRGAHADVEAPGLRDQVAVEEPLEIRVDGVPLAVTMRTPGHDEELALGFLHGEGLIDRAHPAGPPADLAANTIEVTGPLLKTPQPRAFFTTSSCGVCGKGALEQVAVDAPRAEDDGRTIPRDLLADLPNRLTQPTFARTGGLHATGLFTFAGEPRVVREDVGRHNAMDKAIGRQLLDGDRLSEYVACVSGRLSFELVQKVAVARIPILVGVGAPTSLAVSLAEDRNLTLAGFARGGRVNVYTGGQRVSHP